MLKNIFNLKNWCFNLFLGSTMVIMALFGLNTYSQNKIITDFPYGHFRVVDVYSKGGYHWYGEDSIAPNPNRHRLTTSSPEQQRVAMWYWGDTSVPNSGKIDLAADVSFTFRLAFGVGRNPRWSIGDGVMLVFTTQTVTPSLWLIGGANAHIGYGGISQSLAVEFDTEYNGDNSEGANIASMLGKDSKFTLCHTKFLQNGSMNHLNGLKPLQNDTASVEGKEICVRVDWLRNLDSGGYNLRVFTQELGNNSQKNQLVLRNEIYFVNLNSAIQGLTLDSNNQALVTVGITSATCGQLNANRHEIEFIHLENGIYAMTGCPPIEINWVTRSVPLQSAAPPPPGGDIPIFEYVYDLFSGYNCCENSYVYGNQITNTKCLPTYFRHSYLEISGIDMTNSQLYVNDTLRTDTAYYDTTTNKYRFDMSGYVDENIDKDSMIVKIKVGGKEIVFKIKFNDNERVAEEFAKYFATNNIPISVKGNVGSMLVTDDERTQAIALPEMNGCSYYIGNFDSTKFDLPLPHISNGTPRMLHFTLKEGECYADLPLRISCIECPSRFIFKIHGFNGAVAKNASCKGAEIRYSSCNSDEVNDLVMFKIYDSNGVLVDSSVGSKSSVFTKKSGNYTYKFYNIITGKELDSGDIQINETDLDLPFSFEITDFTKEVFPNGDGTFYCYFNVKIFVSDITQFNGYNLVATANGDPVASIEPYYSLHIGNGRSFQAKFTVLCSDSDDDFKFIASVMHAEEDLYTDNLVEISVCSDTIFLSCSCKNKCDSLDIDVFFNANNLYYDKVLMPTGEKIKFAKLGLTPETNGKCFFDFPLPANYQLVEVSGFFTPDSLPPLPSNILKFTMNSPCVFLGGEGGGLGNHLVFNSRTFKFIFVDDNGDSCLIEKTFHCGCYVFKFNLFQTGTTVRVEYEMADILIPFLPLNIFLTDNTGNKLRHLLAISESNQLNGHFDIDMLELPSGIYHIVIETGNNEILGSEQFIFTK